MNIWIVLIFFAVLCGATFLSIMYRGYYQAKKDKDNKISDIYCGRGHTYRSARRSLNKNIKRKKHAKNH